MFKKLIKFVKVPLRFSRKARNFRISHRLPRPTVMESAPQPAPVKPHVPDLFGPIGMPNESLTLKSKYGSKRKRKSKRKPKGLQYKLQFWKGVQGERKLKFKTKVCEVGQTNDYDWSEAEYRLILGQLVEDCIKEIKDLGIKESLRIAEIIHWMHRSNTDDPFNFELACALAAEVDEDADGFKKILAITPLDPDDMRVRVLNLIRKLYGGTFPHAAVLRNGIIDAEYGDPDAIAWVLSDASTAFSFRECCEALDFDHEKARECVLLPIVVDDDIDAHERVFEALDAVAA